MVSFRSYISYIGFISRYDRKQNKIKLKTEKVKIVHFIAREKDFFFNKQIFFFFHTELCSLDWKFLTLRISNHRKMGSEVIIPCAERNEFSMLLEG